MKILLYTIPLFLSLTSFTQKADEKIAIEIAEGFIMELYSGNYEKVLAEYSLSDVDSDFYIMKNVKERILKCQSGAIECYLETDFEFVLLHLAMQQRDENKVIDVFFQFKEHYYDIVTISNYGKGWFIAYANVLPHFVYKSYTMDRLKEIKKNTP